MATPVFATLILIYDGLAYIYPVSEISVPKWIIRTQSPQQLDDHEGQYNSQVPIVQVQPVAIFEFSSFADRSNNCSGCFRASTFNFGNPLTSFRLSENSINFVIKKV